MRVITAAEIARALPYPELIERIRRTFRGGTLAPPPTRHPIATLDGLDAALEVATGWSWGNLITVRIGTCFEGNSTMPRRMGAVMVLSARTGEPLALLDGPTLLQRRTAATSALAASYLARTDASRLLVMGTGPMAVALIEAHTTVRPVREVLVWGRDGRAAKRLAKHLRGGFPRPTFIDATDDLEQAVSGADIVCCATAATEPVLQGAWLRDGVHLDLVGSTTPDSRESDDDAVRRARIFADTRDGALNHAGDLVQPIADAVLTAEDLAADLFDLARGDRAGRRFYDQITLFKCAGSGVEDVAAAQMVLERV